MYVCLCGGLTKWHTLTLSKRRTEAKGGAHLGG